MRRLSGAAFVLPAAGGRVPRERRNLRGRAYLKKEGMPRNAAKDRDEKVAKDNVDKVNKMPAKSIVEGGKIYLAKEDGTKLDSGTELPAGGSTIEVVNNLESDSTTAALSAAQGKALNTQYKDIVNKIENGNIGTICLQNKGV